MSSSAGNEKEPIIKQVIAYVSTTEYLIIIILSMLLLVGVLAFGQSTNLVYEKHQIGDASHLLVGIDLAPDGNTMIVTGNQSYPAYLFDYKNKSVVREYDIGNWYAGSRVDFSKNAKYMMVQQLFYIDWSMNKDREVNFNIVDVETGNEVLSLNNYHDVEFSPDEQFVYSLNAEEVSKWDLTSGKKVDGFKVNQATNALAVSKNGKLLAVSHRPSDEFLKNYYQKDKKAIKAAKKFYHQITIYDAITKESLFTLDGFHDIVYRLEFTDDDWLFIYAIPHTKVQNRMSFLSRINMKTHTLSRTIIPSTSLYEAHFEFSPNKEYIAISSSGRYPEVHIYSYEDAKLLYRIEMSFRLFENLKEGEVPPDGRAAFTFLPDNETLVIVYGNRLLEWKFLE